MLNAKFVSHAPVFSVQKLQVSGGSAGNVCVQKFPPWGLGCLCKGSVHSFSNLYRLPTLCGSGQLGLGHVGHLPASHLEEASHAFLWGACPTFSLPSFFFITPTPGVRPMARPPPLLGPGFRGQLRRAGRARVCAQESGCRLQGTRVAGARAPRGARRSSARDPRTRAWPPACLASPSRALSSTVFATMFSSSMGCSAARPARPRRRPGPPTRAGADGDRRGSARLGWTDRAAASRASPASPAAAARRAL